MSKKEQCTACQQGNAGPCNSALERIYAIQGSKKKIDSDVITAGCPWFVNSAEHNYCFWKYAEQLDEPIPDKDICDLLMIDTSTLNSTFDSAIAKLRDLKDTPELQEFKEALLDKMSNEATDDTVYLPDEFSNVVDQALLDAKNTEHKDSDADLFEDKPKKRKTYGMPTHRDGKKTDIYGLYTKKTRDRIQHEKTKKNK